MNTPQKENGKASGLGLRTSINNTIPSQNYDESGNSFLPSIGGNAGLPQIGGGPRRGTANAFDMADLDAIEKDKYDENEEW